MRLLKATLLFIIISTLCAEAQGPLVADKLKKIANAFDTLTVAERENYVKHKHNAFKARQNEKYFTCMNEISDARAIFADDMDLLFLNGICRAQLHDIDKAIEFYNQVLEIDNAHMYTLMNLVEINFFAGRYEAALKHIRQVNSIVASRASGQDLPLLDFKYLICLTKLSSKDPEKYEADMQKLRSKYSYMDDNPFYYFSNALEKLDAGDKQEGLIWILKAYLIFESPAMIEIWNKALVDTDFIGAHEIMFNRQEKR